MSGVAVGEGLECGEDASVGGFSRNEDGACINESKESLAGVGDGVGVGEVAFSCAGVDRGFFGVASMSAEGACCSAMPICPLFFGSAPADAFSNLPCIIVPDTWLETI